MSSYALEARGLGKRFGNTVALSGLDLAVSKGEVICLLGANGAGKTTTINLFLGSLQADEGKALVHGIGAGKAPLDARRKLAYLPESVALYPKLSGIENLRFFDRLAGGSPLQQAPKTDEAGDRIHDGDDEDEGMVEEGHDCFLGYEYL